MAIGTPKYLFKDIYEITPEFFVSRGIRLVLTDIDNTLVTYDDAFPTPELKKWFKTMSDAGVEFAFVSNNRTKRVKKFCEPLGFTYVCNAGKPFTWKMKKLLKEKGVDKENAAMIGDQVLTDSLAAAFLGIISINVPPIKARTDAFFRLKRKLEVPFMRAYWAKHPEQSELRTLWYIKTGNSKKEVNDNAR